MVKHRKSKACIASIHKKGHFVEVKTRCHIGKAELVTPIRILPRATKVTYGKPTKKTVQRKYKHTEVPAACKGLKKKARKDCAKKVCAQRPTEYRKDCLQKAGIR